MPSVLLIGAKYGLSIHAASLNLGYVFRMIFNIFHSINSIFRHQWSIFETILPSIPVLANSWSSYYAMAFIHCLRRIGSFGNRWLEILPLSSWSDNKHTFSTVQPHYPRDARCGLSRVFSVLVTGYHPPRLLGYQHQSGLLIFYPPCLVLLCTGTKDSRLQYFQNFWTSRCTCCQLLSRFVGWFKRFQVIWVVRYLCDGARIHVTLVKIILTTRNKCFKYFLKRHYVSVFG